MLKQIDFTPVTIRPCRREDIPAITEIATLTWEGTDYLANVANTWLDDEGFFVAMIGDRLVGVTKLSILPDGVAWLEGLRVHPDFQGHGIARQLNAYLLTNVRRLYREGKVRGVEFCTYHMNRKSIAMGQHCGFQQVWSGYLMVRSLTRRQAAPLEIPLPVDLLTGDYLVAGWKSVHHCPEGITWLQSHARGWQYGSTRFYIGGGNGFEPVAVIPGLNESRLLEIMPALNYLFRGNGEIEIIVSQEQAGLIPILKRHRFHFWSRQNTPNMLIFRQSEDIFRA